MQYSEQTSNLDWREILLKSRSSSEDVVKLCIQVEVTARLEEDLTEYVSEDQSVFFKHSSSWHGGEKCETCVTSLKENFVSFFGNDSQI